MRQSILIVEDDDELRGFLKKVLSANNFEVLEAADGAEALELVEKDRPDLVILDFGLPKVPGETVCVKIKKDYPDIIVIALTEKVHSRDVVRGLQIGADDYMTKPFVAEELIARIDARLKNAKKKDITTVKSADSTQKEPTLIFRESISLIALKFVITELLFGLGFVLSASLLSFLGGFLGAFGTLSAHFIVMVTLLAVNVVTALFIVLKWQSEYIELTQDSLIKHTGIFNKREQKYACNFVELITLEQSMLGMMFNYGTIELYDPALKEQIYLVNIANPKKYREVIEKRVSTERSRPMPFIAQE